MQQESAEASAQTEGETPRYTTQLQRLLQHGKPMDVASSMGEAIVPFFLAAVEACWFNAILIGLAGVDFLHTDAALLPFWGPFLLLGVALWLFQRVLYKEARTVESTSEQEQSPRANSSLRLLFSVLALLDIGLIWLRIYAGTNFLLDPRWLLTFAGDLFSLNDHFYQALAIVAMTIYFCWRGTKLAQMNIEPAYVWRQMWVGLLVLLAAILLRAGQNRTGGNLDDIVLVLMIPIFLYCSLSAHALARTSFVRRSHPFGLEGSTAVQERAMLSIIGGAGLIMLILTLLGGFFFSTAFFNSLQPTWQVLATLYGWLVSAIIQLLTWIFTPIFILISWLFSLGVHPSTPRNPPTSPINGRLLPPVTTTPPGIVLVARFILPLLILLGLMLILWLALRRRKRLRITRNRASGDVHESVWSWTLFWHQFKAFWAALFRRQHRTDANAQDTLSASDLPTEPAARTMREIYRALLKKAAALGYTRKRDETPHEFQQRLNQSRTSSDEPQLGQLTEAYALTRYGGSVPDEFDLVSVRRNWEELEKKWQESS